MIRLLAKLYCSGKLLCRCGARILMYWRVHSASALRFSSHFARYNEFCKQSIKSRQKEKGFSLLEVVLVLAIMATVMVAIIGYTTQKSDEMRRDKIVMQIQQVLNAGLSYYVSFGSWPLLTDLQGNFLPSGVIKNPWGQLFSVGVNTTGTGQKSQFSVCTPIVGKQAYTAATVIAGRLPMAFAVDGTSGTCPPASTTSCTVDSTTCTVVSSVNIPGQNLNNARSINFAGLYRNGACVPAPVCPLNMKPTILVTPASVSGKNDKGSTAVYPISSFTAYAIGEDGSVSSPTMKPLSCNSPTKGPEDCKGVGAVGTTDLYWRVCIRVVTSKGLLTGKTNDEWAQNAGVILALTRCMPVNEPTIPQASGSPFSVFVNDDY